MSDARIETAQGICVVALTKHLMKRFAITADMAYGRLIDMEVYSLLMDSETALFLETNQYLCKACDLELEHGSEALYDYISRE